MQEAAFTCYSLGHISNEENPVWPASSRALLLQ